MEEELKIYMRFQGHSRLRSRIRTSQRTINCACTAKHPSESVAPPPRPKLAGRPEQRLHRALVVPVFKFASSPPSPSPPSAVAHQSQTDILPLCQSDLSLDLRCKVAYSRELEIKQATSRDATHFG